MLFHLALRCDGPERLFGVDIVLDVEDGWGGPVISGAKLLAGSSNGLGGVEFFGVLPHSTSLRARITAKMGKSNGKS
jgi:hypothetical protein